METGFLYKGVNKINWNGRFASGVEAGSGIYICCLTSPSGRETCLLVKE
ncbi:MAG: hypothetical protein IPH45_02505 [Bacteroidales bacterium]|nr:hypothetical protein [Bacteroidales bacterium]